MLLTIAFFGLPILFVTVLGGGMLLVGVRAGSEAEAVRWTGYVFLAAFAVLMLWTMIMGYIGD